MDKKNTMLLTVIAVATLLVAVVGATFAYFSVSVNNTENKTTVTGSTGKIPTITMTNENQNMYLNVSAAEMDKNSENKKYYAVTTAECQGNTSCNKTTQNDVDIFKLSITQGDNDTKYACTGDIKITAAGNMIIDNESLTTGDVSIVLTGLTDENGTTSIDLASLKETANTKTENISYNITGNVDKTIKAYVMIENSERSEQNYLAGKTLNITIAAENVQCSVKQPGA